MPATEEEKKAELDTETPAQKALREEIKKAGGQVCFSAAGQIWLAGLDGSPARAIAKPSAALGDNLEYPRLKVRLLHMGVFDLEKGEERIVTPPDWKKYESGGFTVYSPDGKYLVYMHGECVPGKASYDWNSIRSELYVTRFPPDGVNVRITWLKANVRHPHWWGPAAAK